MSLFEEFGSGSRRPRRTRRGASDTERREADLFFAELTGTALPGPVRPQPRFRRPAPIYSAEVWTELDEKAPDNRASKIAPGPIDAVVKWPTGKVYFFYGADYVRYDVKADKVDAGYPKSIAAMWKGLFTSDIDAAVEWGNGKVYFFKGDQYSRYDIKADKVDPDYPKPIAGNWPGLFTDGIDAAVNWGNGKVFFFKGDQYIRFDIRSDRADPDYPKPIAGNWPGLLFTAGIDDAVNWGNGKVYFFKGDEYIRYDIKTDRADAGYPLAIKDKWSGLHPTTACTCTHTSRKYSSGTVPTANLIGVKATIKTRYGKVCCEGTTATSAAYKVAWTGVTKTSGTMVWAQTGFGRERNSGSATVKNYRYWEVQGTDYNVFYDVGNPPTDGTTHTYQCEVDNTAGKWTFDFDGTNWADHTDEGWKTICGDRADYTGEIFNDTDDMAGTATDKCEYRDCKKKSTGGAYVDAGLTTGNVSSSDATQWGASRISSTGMDIWDKNPLP